MILTAYYDESGTHAGAPLTVLAGFVAPVEEWAHFDREWFKILRKHGIAYVRAKELFHRQKQFKRWTDKQVRHLWADMLYVLQEHKGVFASKTVILDEDYRLFYISDGPAKRERLDTKYALCFRFLLDWHPVMLRSMRPEGSVNFVLEAGHKNAGDALRVFNELKESPTYPARDAIGFMSFGSKRDTPGLQAADALAYWFYKTECSNLEDDYYYELSDLEEELEEMGKDIIGCVITPRAMTDLRKNYLRKQKKQVHSVISFGGGQMVDKTSAYWEERAAPRPAS